MDLTDIDSVKLRLWPDGNAPTTFDDLLEGIIDDVSASIERLRGAPFEEAEYDQHYNGDGTSFLRLNHGPLVEVEEVATVVYQDDGSGGRDGVETAVEAFRWLPRGIRDTGHIGLGWLKRIDGARWPCGEQNIRVAYTAGFADVPPAVKRIATNEVLAEFAAREHAAFSSIQLGDYRVSMATADERANAVRLALGPFLTFGFGFGR